MDEQRRPLPARARRTVLALVATTAHHHILPASQHLLCGMLFSGLENKKLRWSVKLYTPGDTVHIANKIG